MKRIFFVLAPVLFFNCLTVFAQTFSEAGFSTSTIGSGWDQPIGAVFSKNGLKLFVWEKAGKVFVCNRNVSGLYDKQTSPVVDISAEVGNWGDHGLNGFALDPEFAANGLIYLLYVVDRRALMNDATPVDQAAVASIGRVSRYQTFINGSGDLVINPATKAILIGESPSTGIPVLTDSHGMGSLVFATDGTLLVSAGDGASYNGTDNGNNGLTNYAQALTDGIITDHENVGAFRAQLLNSHNGKILRINPSNGNGMASNPFYNTDEPRSPQSRVWALGFRNPFRFNLRPGTGSANPSAGDIGELYVGDVGWRTYEELNIIKAPGMNCGWPIFEGLNYEVAGPYPGEVAYSTFTTQNRDEPNPLFGNGSCSQQYFTFNNLLKQATADGITTVYNPCNASVPIVSGNPNRFFHRRPSIDWQQYTNNARVPIFNGNIAATALIGTPASNVTGTPFPGNCSIGGFWYTGSLFPAQFRNTYFHADLGAKWLKSFAINYTDVVQKVENIASDFPSSVQYSSVVCMAENPLDGTVVFVDIVTNNVRRLTYGGNQYPVVKMESDVKYGPSVLNVSFTGNNSYDPEGGRLTYSWNFGDGSPLAATADATHSFSAAGPKKFTVILTVKDSVNFSATDSIIISVNNTPPHVAITSPVNNSIYRIGTDSTYAFTATVADDEHSSSQLKYEWQQFLRHNNHEHPGVIDTARITAGSIARVGCNGETYYWLVKLKVTDAAGLSTIDSAKIYPACAGSALPIVLRKFSVTQQDNENLVKWTTETAVQIKDFEIERGMDGHHFLSIHHQQARSTTGTNDYSFPDNSFPAGVNYYRLKMIEIGDVVRYSAIVKVSAEIKNESLVVSPNPIVANFSVKYNAMANGPVIIRVIDISGKLVNTIHENVNRGQNIIYLQNQPTWKPGIYLVTVQQANDIQQGKLIKAE